MVCIFYRYGYLDMLQEKATIYTQITVVILFNIMFQKSNFLESIADGKVWV